MKSSRYLWSGLASLALLACTPKPPQETSEPTPDPAETRNAEPKSDAKDWKAEKETLIAEVTQLTFEGDNGEAYFSPDGKRLVFQSKRGEDQFDQIYIMNLDGSEQTRISSGVGRTTCAYFTPDGKGILYASTHLRPETPPKPEGHGPESYEWAFDPAFDIFRYDLETKELTRLTDAPGYDAEGTFGFKWDRYVFTSMRDGDAEIYAMNPDGSGQTRITNAKGYDGGPWLSPDGTKLVWRASRTDNYKDLQIFIADANGDNARQLTQNNATNFAPSWHPSGEWIIFSSDMDEKYNFELYRIRPDGTGLERITYQPGFDGFPVFSPDGKTLIFASNRADPNLNDRSIKHYTHIFKARWVE